MTTGTNAATTRLIQRLGDIATALAAYTHLPSLDRVHVFGDEGVRCFLGFPHFRNFRQKLLDLCAWADACHVPVTIAMSYYDSGEALIEIDLAGHRARLAVTLNSAQAYELGAALHRPITPAAPTISLSGTELRAALRGDSDG